MPCNALTDPVCAAGHVIQSVTAGAAGGVLGGIAQAISDGGTWIVENTATWWVRIPSPDLATEPAGAHPPQWLPPLPAAVAGGRGGPARPRKAGPPRGGPPAG